VLETTGAASKLLLTCDSPSLLADGSDTAQVDIVAVDSQGRMVRTIDAAVSVSWSGAGQLLGLVSGDMHDAESYRGQQGVMRNGRCMANIRAGKTAGQAVLSARVEGLPPAEITIDFVSAT
jgi:beta-galactosidase